MALSVAIAMPLAVWPLDLDRPTGLVGELSLKPISVDLEDGRSVEVESGVLLVPENRSKTTSPAISIPFYRLRSTSAVPAVPIFLLAGGPGSSWIERFEDPDYYEEIAFYRGIADVVLFDQRGAGRSKPELDCDGIRRSLPRDRVLTRTVVAASMVEMSIECRERWISAGVDLEGYTTLENAADVLQLKGALGYSSVSLVGGSYGSHLALALLRLAPQAIDRVLLYGIEGVDQTWDDPAGRLATYERIAGAAEVSEELGPSIPEEGLLELLRGVIERLEENPVDVEVAVGEGDETTHVLVDAFLVRLVAGYQAGRRSRPNAWPEFILDLHQGDYSHIAQAAIQLRELRLDRPMHYMMDCSSGISSQREARLRHDPAMELLGDINFEYAEVCPAWRAPDLGEAFRSPVLSSIPALVVHGTWDTSTPIGNAREVMAGLTNGQLVEVIGGNHGALYNLYNYWPPAHEKIGEFLRGRTVRFPRSVTTPNVHYMPRSQD
ncbi:MAG: alpha/beta hydrolase [Thermoanaerobaculia bacterium]|nr:alpha/beta hydrolase [Thermoanaerobaculia bacterium]